MEKNEVGSSAMPDRVPCPMCGAEIAVGSRKCTWCGEVLAVSHAPVRNWTFGCFTALTVVGIGAVLVALMLPSVQRGRNVSRRVQCKNNLKQIAMALYNYCDAWGAFPPAFVADESGKPMHSWRVLILPYLDAAPLYNQYDFSEPWDGPNNSRLLTSMPTVYACPSHATPAGNTNTAYVGVFGDHCVFRGALPTKITDITDGTSNTLIVGEASGANIPWMKPEDIDVTAHPSLGDPSGFSSDHTGGAQFLMCDGSVRFIALSINPATLRALFTRDGGEVVGDF